MLQMQSAKGFRWESLTFDVSTVLCWKYCLDVHFFYIKKILLLFNLNSNDICSVSGGADWEEISEGLECQSFPPTSFFSKQHSILLSLRQALDKSWIKALCNIVIPLLFHLKGIRILLLLIVDQHLSIFITEIIKL